MPSIAHPYTWGVPLAALLGAAAVWFSNTNQALFLTLNRLGPITGNALWANFTFLGNTLAAFGLLALFLHRRPDIVWALFLAAIFTLLWVHGLKPLFDLPRPLAVLGPETVHVIGVSLHKYAFPSGHTATAFTLAGVICLQRISHGLAIIALSLAVLAGVSRAVVGAHWPLDILGGAFGGWLAAILGNWLTRRWPLPAGRLAQSILGLILLGCGLVLLTVYDGCYPDTRLLQMLIGLLAVASAGHALYRLRPLAT
jgi:membrane-associated phospholipid phosphatase